jgi:hypothetical protein
MRVSTRKVIKRVAVLAGCAGISYSLWLAYCNESTVPGLMLSTITTWINWLVGDPVQDEILATLQTMNTTNVGMQASIERLEREMNRRFDNLQVSLGTPPGAPAGVDETTVQGDPTWTRAPDEDTEERLRRRRARLPDTVVLPPVPLLEVD